MKARALLTLMVAAFVASGAFGQTKNLSQFDELAAAPSAADWIFLWDDSAGVSKKISPANLFLGIPAPTTTVRGGVKRNVGTAGQFVTGISATGDLLYDTPAGGTGITDGDKGDITVSGTGTVWNVDPDTIGITELGVTGGADKILFYDSVGNQVVGLDMQGLELNGPRTQLRSIPVLAEGQIAVGDVNGKLNGSGSMNYNASTEVLTVPTVEVTDEVYGAGWNTSTEVPTKNAVYDKIESVILGGTATLNSTLVGYGSGGNTLTGEAGFEYNATTNTLTVQVLTVTTLNTTNLNAGNLGFEGSSVDGNDTTLGVVNPTGTRSILLPDRSGTVSLDDSTSAQSLLATVGTTQGSVMVRGLSSWIALSPGTAGQVLTSNGTGANSSWQTAPSGSVATDAIYDAKGDLPAGTGSNTAVRLPLGTDGQVLTVDTAEATGLKWATAAGGSNPTIATFRQTPPTMWEEFYGASTSGTTPFGDFGFVREVVGSGAGIDATRPVNTDTAPGVINLYTSGSTATSSVAFMSGSTGIPVLLGGGTYNIEYRVWIPTLNDGTDQFTLRFGLIDSTSAESTDGVFFRYSNAEGTNWFRVTRSNSTETATDTTVAVAEDAWLKLRIQINAAASSVEYFINGTSVGSNTTNIPTGSSRYCSPGLGIYKTAGTGSRGIYMDYVGMEHALTTTR